MKTCPNCHSSCDDGQSFCTNCGSKLSDTQPEKEETPKTAARPEAAGEIRPKRSIGKTIKRVAIFVVVAIIAFCLWVSHMMNSTTYMQFNSEGEVFAKKGGQAEVNIDYDGMIWEVAYKPYWVDIIEYDASFVIECNRNDTGEDREDHITIKSGKIVASLPIGQYGTAQYIQVSESSISCDRSGGTFRIDVESDGFDLAVNHPNYTTVEWDEDGFNVTVDYNDGYTRTGMLNVTADDCTASISLSQEGTCRDCDGNGSRTCASCGGSGYFGYGMYSSTCFSCGGSGSIKCYSCGGEGVR